MDKKYKYNKANTDVEKSDQKDEKSDKIRDLFESHLDFKSSLCKKPCTQTTYEVQSKQKMIYHNSQFGLIFDTTVELTETIFR